MDWNKLIAEVEKHPYLWKTPKGERHIEKLDTLWKQIAANVGFSANKCKARWTYLRFMYIRLKNKVDKKPNYKIVWDYWDQLRFLDDRIQRSKNTGEFNVHEMIAKVKERPYLWKIPGFQRNQKKSTRLWQEVADDVGVNIETCRDKWIKLCTTHKRRMESDPSTHRKWEFCEDLKFLDDVYEEHSSLQNTAQRVEIDKWELISKVKERPHLWQVPFSERNPNINNSLWKEISESLGFDENTCKKFWQDLRAKYGRHKKREEKLLQMSKKCDIAWQYYNALKFLDMAPKANIDATEVKLDKYDLITLVKIRPELWKIERKVENFKKVGALWKEIGEILGVNANVCKNTWSHLRYNYKSRRNVKSTEWEYFEHLKFLDALQDDDSNDAVNNITDNVDKYAFITKVKERPELWRGSPENSSRKYETVCLWKEISDLLDINYDKCKRMWKFMLKLYKSNKKAEEKLLESSKKYYSKWEHYEQMKFLEDVDYKVPDRYTLITKVKQIPKLWKDDLHQRNEKIIANIWNEIAESLGVQEETCRNIWTDLRLLFFKHKEKRDKLLEVNPSAKYRYSFQYFDDLNFLEAEALNPGATRKLLILDKFKFIDCIKERPYLWKTEPKDRNKLISNYYWSQVKEIVNLPENRCQQEWEKLLSLYNEEKKQIEMMKQKNNIDDNNVSRWEYFESMKFLDSGISDQSSDDVEGDDEDATRVRIRMVNEIKKRTPLWINPKSTFKVLNNHLWSEVAKICGFSVKSCRNKWIKLKGRYLKSYNLYKENKISLEAFQKCPNYDLFQFLNEYIDKDDNQHFNSADTEEELSLTQLESVCVKEEPEIQSSSFTNIPLKTIQGTPIKEEQQDIKDNISIKTENSDESHLIEGALETQQQYILAEESPTQSEEYKVKEEPSNEDTLIKEEFEIIGKQENQLENIENASVKVEQNIKISDTTNSLAAVKNECLKVDSCVMVKSRDDSYCKFIKDSTANENNSLTNVQEGKAELSNKRKSSGKMTNDSKVMKKKKEEGLFLIDYSYIH